MSQLLSKNYLLVLLLVVLLSYGQILSMYVWQDDNALFFKLANIKEQAGYLGTGLFGHYVYKYTAFFYYPIFLLFGHKTVAYFTYAIIFYVLASFAVYFSATKVLGRVGGMVAGFLFAAGYIASDGFIRLYNSVPTSIAVILISTFIYLYFEYLKHRKLSVFLTTVVFYFLSVELVMSRTAFIIILPILLEVIFFFEKKSLLRLVPFGIIYYLKFLNPPDSRSSGVVEIVKSFFAGNLQVLNGFLASVSNLFLPDYVPIANFRVFLGLVIIIILTVGVFRIAKERRRMYLFLTIWILSNVFLYSSYNPSLVHESFHRYLAFSFLPLVFLFGLLHQRIGKFKFLIILWGVANIVASIVYQGKILTQRTAPARSFYNQLKNYVPDVKKGDVFYFDVAKEAGGYFSESFSVAQMPEETAIAWRYGLDRYDIKMCTTFDCLVELVETNAVKIDQVYTFFYTKEKLIDTSVELRDSLRFKKPSQVVYEGSATEFELTEPINSLMPNKISVLVSASPDSTIANYAIDATNQFYSDINLQKQAFDYSLKKDYLNKAVPVKVSSEWQDRLGENLYDGDLDSLWQADRLLWLKEKASIIFLNNSGISISTIAWVPGFLDHNPKVYFVDTSSDGETWNEIAKNSLSTQGSKRTQIINFTKTNTKFIRVRFEETVNGDSPAIAEMWLVPTEYSDLDIVQAETFLKEPFKYIISESNFNETLRLSGNKGIIQVQWMSDKAEAWQTSFSSKFETNYNGKAYLRTFELPAGGTKINKLRFISSIIPGEVTVLKVIVE